MDSHRLAKSEAIKNLEITVRILKLPHTRLDVRSDRSSIKFWNYTRSIYTFGTYKPSYI